MFYMLGSFFWIVVESILVGQKSGLCWTPPSGPKSPLKTNCGWVFFEESEHHWPGPPEPLLRYWFFMVLVLCHFDSVTWLCSCSCSCCCCCCCCCCCFLGRFGIDSGGPKIGLMLDPPFRAKIATKNKLRLSILWRVRTSLAWAPRTRTEVLVLHGLGPLPLWFSDLVLFLFLFLLFLLLLLLMLLLMLLLLLLWSLSFWKQFRWAQIGLMLDLPVPGPIRHLKQIAAEYSLKSQNIPGLRPPNPYWGIGSSWSWSCASLIQWLGFVLVLVVVAAVVVVAVVVVVVVAVVFGSFWNRFRWAQIGLIWTPLPGQNRH